MKVTRRQLRKHLKKLLKESIKTRGYGPRPRNDMFGMSDDSNIRPDLLRAVFGSKGKETSADGGVVGKSGAGIARLEDLSLGRLPGFEDEGTSDENMRNYSARLKGFFGSLGSGIARGNLQSMTTAVGIAPNIVRRSGATHTSFSRFFTRVNTKDIFAKIIVPDPTGQLTYNSVMNGVNLVPDSHFGKGTTLEQRALGKAEAAVVFSNLGTILGSDQAAFNFLHSSMSTSTGTPLEYVSLYTAMLVWTTPGSVFHEDGPGRDLIINPGGDEIVIECKNSTSASITDKFSNTQPSYSDDKFVVFRITDKAEGSNAFLIRSDVINLLMYLKSPVAAPAGVRFSLNMAAGGTPDLEGSIAGVSKYVDMPSVIKNTLETDNVLIAAQAILNNADLLELFRQVNPVIDIAQMRTIVQQALNQMSLTPDLTADEAIVLNQDLQNFIQPIRKLQIRLSTATRLGQTTGEVADDTGQTVTSTEAGGIRYDDSNQITRIFGLIPSILRGTRREVSTNQPAVLRHPRGVFITDQLQLFLGYVQDQNLLNSLRTLTIPNMGKYNRSLRDENGNNDEGVVVGSTDTVYVGMQQRILYNLKRALKNLREDRVNRSFIKTFSMAMTGYRFLSDIRTGGANFRGFSDRDLLFPIDVDLEAENLTGLFNRPLKQYVKPIYDQLTAPEKSLIDNYVNRFKEYIDSGEDREQMAKAEQVFGDMGAPEGLFDFEEDAFGRPFSPLGGLDENISRKIYKNILRELLKLNKQNK